MSNNKTYQDGLEISHYLSNLEQGGRSDPRSKSALYGHQPNPKQQQQQPRKKAASPPPEGGVKKPATRKAASTNKSAPTPRARDAKTGRFIKKQQ